MTLPGVLLPYQRRWIEDASRVRVWEKSRRVGASWSCAVEAVIEASQVDGQNTWYTSYNKETTQEFIRDCADWCRAVQLAIRAGEEVEVTKDGDEILTYVIRFDSGHRITALSSKPSNLRNRKGRIIIDEAAHREDFGEALKAALAVLMWGGRIDILSTHNGVDSDFNKIVTDVREERRDYNLHRTTLDEALDEGLYRRICLVTGERWTAVGERAWRDDLVRDYGDDADEELFCVPRRSGGMYLSRPVIEDRMVEAPVFRFEVDQDFAQLPDKQRARTVNDWLTARVLPLLGKLPKSLMHAFGEDFGRTADLTVIAPITVCQNLRRVVPFLVELRNVPFREQELALNFVVDRLHRLTYGALDATGNGQYMAERAWQRYGESVVEQVNLTEKWYGENLPPLKAAFDDDMLTIPRDADVLTDLMAFQVINGIPKLPKHRTTQQASAKRRKSKRHGDAGVALALAHYASRQPAVTYDGYKSVGKRAPSMTVRRRGGGFRSRPGGIL